MCGKRHCRAALTAWLAVTATGCSFGTIDLSQVLAPSPVMLRVTAVVSDDGDFLPPGLKSKQPLAGAKVTVILGPQTGRVAFTNAEGEADLGEVALNSTVQATKDGWSSENGIVGQSGNLLQFVIGQAPHTMWGTVTAVGSTGPLSAAGVLVRISSGVQHVGMTATTDSTGTYRFDNLSTQSIDFSLTFSKEGLRDASRSVPAVRRNFMVPNQVMTQ